MAPFLEFHFFWTFLPETPFSVGKNLFFSKKSYQSRVNMIKKVNKNCPQSIVNMIFCQKNTVGVKKKNEYPKSSIVFFDGSTKFILVNLIFEFQASTFNFLRLPKYAVGLNPRLKAPSCRNSLLYFEWVHQIYNSKFDFWISKNPKLLITP